MRAEAARGAALAARAMAASRRLWPETLFGRLVLILVSGMLAAQFLTSSVWLNVRYQQLLEAPTRVVGERTADLLGLLARGVPLEQATAMLAHGGFDVALRQDAAAPAPPPRDARMQEAETLLGHVVHQRLPKAGRPRLVVLELFNEDGNLADWHALLGFERVTVAYDLRVPVGDGRWLAVHARLPQGWRLQSGWAVLGDLLWRVYLVRILVVVALVMLAVKWVVGPLARLARAAHSIERDVDAAPALAESGPREVRHAAQAFNRMRQRIAEHVADRTRFLAAVSHDLRSPITRMRLRLELLEGPELDEAKARLRGDLADMESLIDATLAFIQAGQRPGVTQRLDIDSLVRSACQDWQALGARLHLEGGIEGLVAGHGQSLRRALDNLVDNALRYAGHARVVLAVDAGHAEIRVLDEGPGIAPGLMAQVRQPFVRGEASRNARTGGHGLGLSIVDAIVKAHGGVFELAARDGQPGLEARIRLPLLAAAPG